MWTGLLAGSTPTVAADGVWNLDVKDDAPVVEFDDRQDSRDTANRTVFDFERRSPLSAALSPEYVGEGVSNLCASRTF